MQSPRELPWAPRIAWVARFPSSHPACCTAVLVIKAWPIAATRGQGGVLKAPCPINRPPYIRPGEQTFRERELSHFRLRALRQNMSLMQSFQSQKSRASTRSWRDFFFRYVDQKDYGRGTSFTKIQIPLAIAGEAFSDSLLTNPSTTHMWFAIANTNAAQELEEETMWQTWKYAFASTTRTVSGPQQRFKRQLGGSRRRITYCEHF